jgi:uncharacterized low-complexity protein
MNLTKTSLTLALTTALGTSGLAVADGNPFSMQSLSHGYMVAEASMPGGEGKAAEGKCGGSKAPAKSAEGKCGEAKCGASKDTAKDTEGKCGAKMQPAKSAEGKCGEAKCGASKGK